jgi:chaperonin GroES
MSIKYPTPLADRVIILPDTIESEPKTGAFSVPDELKDKPRMGVVKAAGKGFYAKDTGTFVPNELKEGDRVLYGSRAGSPIGIEGVEHLLMKQDDVTCKI